MSRNPFNVPFGPVMLRLDDVVISRSRDRDREMLGYPPGYPQPSGDARRMLAEAEQIINTLQAQLKSITDAPKQLALVLRVGGGKATVLVGGVPIEVNDIGGLKPGMQVKLAKTGQIAEVDRNPASVGEVCVVRRVAGDVVEIDHNASVRAIARGEAEVEGGDRVVVDASASVVLRVLPRAQSEFAFARTAPVQWEDIGGLDEAKAALVEAIELPHKHRDVFTRYGKRPVRGVLLYGPPGCGKTLIAKATATALARVHGQTASAGFLYIKGPEILSQWVGAAEGKIREIFASTRAYAKQHGHPAVVFIDEAEAILGARGSSIGSGMERTIVPQFLAEMDGLEESGALVLLATNRPDALDPAVVRDGRIDRKVRIGRPGKADAVRIFALALRGRPTREPIPALAGHAARELFGDAAAMFRVVTKTEKHPITLGHMTNGAMIAGIVERAATAAMLRDVHEPSDEFGITRDDLSGAVLATLAEQESVDHREAVREFVESHKHGALFVERVERTEA